MNQHTQEMFAHLIAEIDCLRAMMLAASTLLPPSGRTLYTERLTQFLAVIHREPDDTLAQTALYGVRARTMELLAQSFGEQRNDSKG